MIKTRVGDKRRKDFGRIIALGLSFIIMICAVQICFAKNVDAVRHARVLFISSYDYDWDSIPKQLEGFSSVINGSGKVDYVFMGTKTHSYDEVKDGIYEDINRNIERQGQYDLIVLGDDAALDFGIEYRTELFDGLPMVFEGINTEEKAEQVAKDPLITGVVESFPMDETIAMAESVCKDATKIVAIVDDTESGQGSLQQYYDCETNFPELDFEELDCSKLTDDEIESNIASYGKDTILLYLMLSHNVDGYTFSAKEAAKMITEAAKVPVFKADEIGIGDGLLGGVVISYDTMGAQAGQMAVDILNGTAVKDIAVTTTPFHTVVDEKIMKNFGIDAKLFPEDTTFLNHNPSFWETYHKVLIPTGAIIGCLSIILILAVTWSRRKKSYYKDLHEKDLMLDNLIKNIPGGIVIYKFSDRVETLFSSDGIYTMCGRTKEEYDKWVEGNIFEKTIYEEDVEEVQRTIMNAVRKRKEFMVTYRMKHKNGTNIWVQLSAVPIREENKSPIYYAVFSELPDEAVLYRSITTKSPTGVYICDTQNYDMLYANESVLESLGKQDGYEGKKCYEFLMNRDYPCEDCRMYEMRTDDFTVREYDFGEKHLNLRGKIFNWHGMKAHIEYVVDDTYRYNEQKAKEASYLTEMNLLSRVNENCIGSFKLNVTQNRIEKGYGENLLLTIGVKRAETIDNWIENAKTFLLEEAECDTYIGLFNREHLKESFDNGEKTVFMEHRMKLDEKTVRWCKTTVVMTRNPETEDIEGYIYAEDIHIEKLLKILTEKALQINSEMLLCLDIANNTHVMFDCADTSKPIYFEDSRTAFLDYINKYFDKDDVEVYCQKFAISKIVSELEKKKSYSLSYAINKEDGRHYKQAAFTYLDKQINLIALSITDITDIYNQHKEQAEKIKNALQEAEAANTAKTEFLARMSHDMRTPMNGILGLSYLMEEQTDIAEIKKDIPKLRESGDYLLQLINDVLDVNKIESKKYTLYPKPCDEKQIFDSIIEMVTPQMEQKSIDFHFEKINIDWKYMILDAQRVKQIFVNLLSNAVKFTPVGGRVDFIMELVSEKDGMIKDKFIIRDNGVGMSEDFIPKIFEPFAQENRVEEGLGGTGLGLSIVKNLVELMDGSISVESKLNEGSTFTLYLNFPLVEEQVKEVKKPVLKEGSKLPEHVKILLCEDHPLNAKIAMKLLEKQGAIVTWKQNGQLGVEAFEKSEINYYDVVLMDIRMPVMDGLTATRTIRALERADAKMVPIIAMTANAYEEDIQKSLDAGMNAHLAKPVSPDKMISTIIEHLSR